MLLFSVCAGDKTYVAPLLPWWSAGAQQGRVCRLGFWWACK